MVTFNALNTLNKFDFLFFVVVVFSERMNTIIMQEEVFAPLRMHIPEKLHGKYYCVLVYIEFCCECMLN